MAILSVNLLALAGPPFLSLSARGAFVLYASAVIIPLIVLGYALRIYPRRRLVLVTLGPALVSLGLFFSKELVWTALAANAIVAVVAIIDLFTLPRRRQFAVERKTGRVVSLRQGHAVELTVTNRAVRPIEAWLCDDVPQELAVEPSIHHLELQPQRRTTVEATVRATRRGAFTLAGSTLRVTSRMGLWQRLLWYPGESVVHVYPDMKQLGEYAVLARTNRLALMGVRRTRRVGEDNEFERLRDYTPDDNYRHIDWRTTARRRKLTVKDFQANQSQRLIVLVDCGRMMTGEAAGLSLLDHALNAMLMLGYVALARGDSVGMLCFSSQVLRYIPPQGGMRHLNRLLHASFNVFPELVESRYDDAFVYLSTHCRKRSLVILITNVIDEVNAQQVRQYLTNLVGRHLPLAALLRERSLFAAVDAPSHEGSELYRAAAAADILLWRQKTIADLRAAGALALDVFPEQLTAPLVNSYLSAKARHLL